MFNAIPGTLPYGALPPLQEQTNLKTTAIEVRTSNAEQLQERHVRQVQEQESVKAARDENAVRKDARDHQLEIELRPRPSRVERRKRDERNPDPREDASPEPEPDDPPAPLPPAPRGYARNARLVRQASTGTLDLTA
ncbi:MAG: hypothetical protein HQL82_13790 [Magnetococcales bacterium]|nr:hypothetical protein [Magnetococcales bacterium]